MGSTQQGAGVRRLTAPSLRCRSGQLPSSAAQRNVSFHGHPNVVDSSSTLRKQTCRGFESVEVTLAIESVAGGGGLYVSDEAAAKLPTSRCRACLEEGVREAIAARSTRENGYAVTVVDATDHSGESAPIAYKWAARNAMEAYLTGLYK